MEGKTGSIIVRPADLLLVTVPIDLAANSPGRLFNNLQLATVANLHDLRQVTWHTHLKDTVVQLETAQAWGAPTTSANSRSKAATSGPR
jgi:hypothetical protein